MLAMFIWIAIILGTVFLDQLTKYLTVLYLKTVSTVPLWEGVLHLTYVENTGAAFGIMKDQRWLFMTVSSVAIVALLIYLFWKKPQSKLECVALTFIIGGGIGNMIDRVALGYVVDMIDFRLINFAVFNVADSFVCVGAGLLMLWLILSAVAEYKAEKAKRLVLAEGEEIGTDDAVSADDGVDLTAESTDTAASAGDADTPSEEETHD